MSLESLLGAGWRLAMVGQSKVGMWVETASAPTSVVILPQLIDKVWAASLAAKWDADSNTSSTVKNYFKSKKKVT
jgi:hypothetical protein